MSAPLTAGEQGIIEQLIRRLEEEVAEAVQVRTALRAALEGIAEYRRKRPARDRTMALVADLRQRLDAKESAMLDDLESRLATVGPPLSGVYGNTLPPSATAEKPR